MKRIPKGTRKTHDAQLYKGDRCLYRVCEIWFKDYIQIPKGIIRNENQVPTTALASENSQLATVATTSGPAKPNNQWNSRLRRGIQKYIPILPKYLIYFSGTQLGPENLKNSRPKNS